MKKSAIFIARTAAKALEEKKAEDVVLLKMPRRVSLFNYFVIATASSRVHSQALARSVLEEMKKQKIKCLNQHGYESGAWILLDFGRVVVHIFLPRFREFYDLEGFWLSAKRVNISE